MKKVLSLVCLLALVATCLFAFASCGAPNEDPAEAKKALEDNGYTVEMTEHEGVTYLTAISETDIISIKYYATEEAAEAAYKKAEEEMKKYEEASDADKATMDGYIGIEGVTYADLEYGMSGKMVWSGTSQAVSDAK